MEDNTDMGASYGATVSSRGGMDEVVRAPRTRYRLKCRDKDGNVKWAEDIMNTVMTAGVTDLVDKYFKGSAYTAAWYAGLIDNSSFTGITATNTMASHSGWLESTAYSSANRPTVSFGTAASGSIANSASPASFDINATATINGAFVANNNTKGGSAGTLYSAGSFASTRSVSSGDTLNVTITLSAS